MPFIPDRLQQPRQSKIGFTPDKKTISGFLGNTVKSGANLVGGIGSAAVNVFNPDMEKNTVANIANLGLDAAEAAKNVVMGEPTLDSNRAKQLAKSYDQKYGISDFAKGDVGNGINKIGNTFYEDPAGVALDASMVAGGIGSALKGAGAVSKIGALENAGKVAAGIGETLDPLALPGKVIKTTPIQNAFRKLGKNVEKSGEQLITRGIGNPLMQAKLEAKSGMKTADFIDKYNLYDRSPEIAGDIKKAIGSKYDTISLKSGKATNLGQVINDIDKNIIELTTGENAYSNAAKAQAAELIRRRKQLIDMAGGTRKMPYVDVGIDKLTKYRKALDQDIPQAQFMLDAKGSGTAQGAKSVRDVLRKTINDSDPRLAKLGREYGMAKGMEKILTNSAAREANRQVFNFSKLGGAGIGGILSGAPGAIGGFVAEQVVNDPRFIKVASKGLRAVGKNMQKFNIPKIPGNNYFRNAAKIGIVTNPNR